MRFCICILRWIYIYIDMLNAKTNRNLRSSSSERYTVVAETVAYFHLQYSLKLVLNWCFILLNYSCKSWSIIKIRDSFEICRSWGFQSCPWKLNLTKIWLRKSRYKTIDISISKKCLRLDFVFDLDYLWQILVKFKFQGQFWNLHVLSIPKLSLNVKFDQDLRELIKVKDKVKS